MTEDTQKGSKNMDTIARSKISTFFGSRKSSLIVALVVVLAVAAAGSYIMASGASGFFATVEPASTGTTAGNAKVVSDATAASGKAIQFTAAVVTPPPTTPPPTGGGTGTATCPAYPAFPDASCTGYAHTGVTLHDCAARITAPGTYDSCKFSGDLIIQSTGVKVTRSLINGGHVESVYPNAYDLKGVVFEDVQIIGAGDDGSAAIGNNDYTCRRCDVSNNNRGFAVSTNVVVVDSYAHDFWKQPASQQQSNSAHQTAISTHGGSNVQIIHNTLHCSSDHYACSSGFSFYSEDAPGIDNVLVQNNRISTDAGYATLFGTFITGKPYGITNVRMLDNVISSEEYGPVANWPSNQAGNVWSGNKSPTGAVINPD